MPTTGETPAHNRQSKLQHLLIGTGKNVIELAFRGATYSLPRRYFPWENTPVIGGLIREHTVIHALDAIREQADPTSEEYQQIFGNIPSHPTRRGRNNQRYGEIKYLGKGWNSVAYEFTGNDGKQFVVKIGSKFSPDSDFVLNPNDPKHAEELRRNIAILEEGMRDFNLPGLITKPQIIQHVKFNNFLRFPLERTIHIMPKETIIPLQEIALLLETNPDEAKILQDEYEQFTKLRSRMIHTYDVDFDLDDPGNVVIVREPDSEGVLHHHIRVLDIGLRVQGTNRPLSDWKLDVTGIIHATQMKRAIDGTYASFKDTVLDALSNPEVFEKYVWPEATLMQEGTSRRRQIRTDAKQHFFQAIKALIKLWRGNGNSGNEDFII